MSSEEQRIVQEPDTWDEGACPGRHRAPASAARRLSVRLGVAALGILLATGLGAVTADALGLTEVGQLTGQGVPSRMVPPDVEEEPRAGRTIDLGPWPAPHSPQPDAVAPEPSPEPPPATVVHAAQPPPVPDPGRQPSPAPVPRVRTGDTCQAVGQTGRTAEGSTVVCTASRGNGPSKWRVA